MWTDILTIGSLEQVLDTLSQIKLVTLQITGITGMEPTIFINSSGSSLRLLIIAFRDSLSTQKYFILVTDLHFYIRHHGAYGTNFITLVKETRNSSSRFGQTIANQHIDTYRMNKFTDFIRHGSSSSREKVSVLNTNRLFQ